MPRPIRGLGFTVLSPAVQHRPDEAWFPASDRLRSRRGNSGHATSGHGMGISVSGFRMHTEVGASPRSGAEHFLRTRHKSDPSSAWRSELSSGRPQPNRTELRSRICPRPDRTRLRSRIRSLPDGSNFQSRIRPNPDRADFQSRTWQVSGTTSQNRKLRSDRGLNPQIGFRPASTYRTQIAQPRFHNLGLNQPFPDWVLSRTSDIRFVTGNHQQTKYGNYFTNTKIGMSSHYPPMLWNF